MSHINTKYELENLAESPLEVEISEIEKVKQYIYSGHTVNMHRGKAVELSTRIRVR